MPKFSADATPKYRKHRASGQAIVTLSGRDHYLGQHGTAASRREYDRLIAEWIAGGRLPLAAPQQKSIMELLVAYLKHAKSYYAGSGEYDNMQRALAPLKEIYGRTLAAEFGPLKLKAIRQKLIESGLCRNEVNQRVGRIKRFWGWAVENEHVPATVLHGLQAVRGLAHGRTEVRESEPIKPVPEALVDAVKPHCSPQIWAMIELQRYSGMRPGEVVVMRTADIDTSGKVWIFTPRQHKSAWRGHDRKIYLGPRAQAVLKPWLRTNLEQLLFQPAEAVAWQREQRNAKRKTPASCGNAVGSNRKANPQRKAGERYTTRTYYVAIRRACEPAFDMPPELRARSLKTAKAKVKAGKLLEAEYRKVYEMANAWHALNSWAPNQLRHNAATWLRKEFGLDVARVVLGHRSPSTTEIYAELDGAKAAEAMARVG